MPLVSTLQFSYLGHYVNLSLSPCCFSEETLLQLLLCFQAYLPAFVRKWDSCFCVSYRCHILITAPLSDTHLLRMCDVCQDTCWLKILTCKLDICLSWELGLTELEQTLILTGDIFKASSGHLWYDDFVILRYVQMDGNQILPTVSGTTNNWSVLQECMHNLCCMCGE